MASKRSYDSSNHDFYDLLVDNDKNSTRGMFPDGDYDERGFPWNAIRCVAVNLHQVQDVLLTSHVRVLGQGDKGMALLQGPTSGALDQLEWSYKEAALPLMPTREHAGILVRELLERRELKVDFPVAGVIVLIGIENMRKFWVGFDPAWPKSARPGAVVEIVAPPMPSSK